MSDTSQPQLDLANQPTDSPLQQPARDNAGDVHPPPVDAHTQRPDVSRARDQLSSKRTGQTSVNDRPADGSAGQVHKFGQMEFTEQELQDFLKTKGEADLKKATLPASPNDYKLALPESFKPPAGVEVRFNEQDPAFVDLRAYAHREQWSQQQLSDVLSIYGSTIARGQATINAAYQAEIAKLGANGAQRVTAIDTWIRGMVGEDVAKPMRAVLVTEKQVRGFEKLMEKFSSQGTASFSQSHRATPDTSKIPGYADMSFEQRRFAQDQIGRRT